jgi:16S rRNA (cytosine1402-N4)-methyltransferase
MRHVNSFHHIPVLPTEVLEGLRPRPGGKYVDATIGGAGHAAAILTMSGPTGWLLGVDRDGAALTVARKRLAAFGARFELRHGTFDRLAEWLPAESCDGVLFDLGVSSPQLDQPERGFSFQADGPLDMRMDPTQPVTAANVVHATPAEELERILAEFGEEPRARRLARAIDKERKVRPLTTTGQLAALIERVVPRTGGRHPATRTFQALRMVVNDELGQLRRGLEAALVVLRPGGRIAVITFQSLEVRVIKNFGDRHARDYDFSGTVDIPELRRPKEPALKWIHRRGIVPSQTELDRNPRARSAQLRVMEKAGHGT